VNQAARANPKRHKLRRSLGFWQVTISGYNVLAIPIAAAVFYPSLGVVLRPEWAAVLMSVSSIIVATDAVLLKRVESELSVA